MWLFYDIDSSWNYLEPAINMEIIKTCQEMFRCELYLAYSWL